MRTEVRNISLSIVIKIEEKEPVIEEEQEVHKSDLSEDIKQVCKQSSFL